MLCPAFEKKNDLDLRSLNSNWLIDVIFTMSFYLKMSSMII